MQKFPLVSICTPTYNRRPFIPMIIRCFEHQTYPKNKIEWIIVDDGTDKIDKLVSHIPQVKYIRVESKLTLGKKRNLAHSHCTGDIIIYMDDDDYYPPDRISHAVEMLCKYPDKLCAGSSEMFIYYKHIKQMYTLGPYKDNHATAATFAFRKELLRETKFDETACIAEEKHFLKNYSIPMIQLDSLKTILVFSHEHNSFDKKQLLTQSGATQNKFVNKSNITVDSFVKDKDIYKFFMHDIDDMLSHYEPGSAINKPDVLLAQAHIQIERHKQSRALLENELIKTNTIMNKMQTRIQELELDNKLLIDKTVYLNDKIKFFIQNKITETRNLI